jgi:hypothetical protein
MFSKLFSLLGVELSFGFDEVNDLEDYAFLVDEETFNDMSKVKLRYFMANFHKFIA